MKKIRFKQILIALIAFLAIVPNATNAQTNPYYTGNTPPPIIERYVHYHTGNLIIKITSPVGNVINDDIYNIYTRTNGTPALLASGTLQNGNIVATSLPITEGTVIIVTINSDNPEFLPATNIGFVLWTDTISKYDACINSNNPFDYYGRIHNKGLDYYINHRTYLGSDSVAILNDIIGRLGDFAQIEPALANEDINDVSFNTSVLSPTHSDPIVNSLTQTLYDVIYFFGEEQNISICVNSIKQIEDGMSNYVENQTVTEEDAADFYKMSAVAKYSLMYWYDVATDANSPWRDFEDYGDDEVTPAPIWGALGSFFSSIGSAISSVATAVGNFVTNNYSNVLGIVFCTGLDIGGFFNPIPSPLLNAIASSAAGGALWGSGWYPFPGWHPWIP